MKRNVLLSLLIILSLFMVVGCGSKKEVDSLEPETTNKEKEKNNKETNTNSNSDVEDIDLYSDDTKIVFATPEGKVVFYYEGNTITAYHAYFDYGDKAGANMALSIIDYNEDDTIDKAYVKGKYLVVEYAKSEYENMTLDQVKLVYSYLEEVQKKSS